MKKLIQTVFQVLTPLRMRRLFLATVSFSIVTSFFVQHVLSVQPCQMCLWQRYTHIFLLGCAVLINLPLFAAVPFNICVWRRRIAAFAILPATIYGFVIASWQSLSQLGFVTLPEGCEGDIGATLATGADLFASLQTQTPMPACDKIDFAIFGLSMAMWDVAIMLGLFILGTMIAKTINK